jgi:hypothetical protein
MADKLKSVAAGKASREPGKPNSFIESVVDAVTGWKSGKGDDSGRSGRERSNSIDSQIDDMTTGKKKP